jgi:hypothetical protein
MTAAWPMRMRSAGFLVALVIFTTHCDDPPLYAPHPPHLCRLRGCLGIASITLGGPLEAASITGEACFDAYCRRFATEPGDAEAGSAVCLLEGQSEQDFESDCSFNQTGELVVRLAQDGDIHHPDPSRFSLTVRDHLGVLLFVESATAPLGEPYYPNGKECDKDYYCQSADVRFELGADGGTGFH